MTRLNNDKEKKKKSALCNHQISDQGLVDKFNGVGGKNKADVIEMFVGNFVQNGQIWQSSGDFFHVL